ncbi:MAG: hypothetical protein R3F11_31310 [Verrucomicrobiales bacterium]
MINSSLEAAGVGKEPPRVDVRTEAYEEHPMAALGHPIVGGIG